MRKRFVVLATLLFAASFPWQASASTFNFSFYGPGVMGTIELTYGTATDSKYPQAFEITGISGTFTDVNNGLNIINVPIGLIVPITRDMPEPTNLLAPNDFSRYAVAAGLPPENHGFSTYDNLYYPGGAPPTASDYDGAGGLVDIYGLLFSIGGGRVVNFWSNGDFSGTGPFSADYGVSVVSPTEAFDYVSGDVAIVPEPGTLGLIGSGLLGVLVWRRRLGL
jgi:PEP-CTERM motif